MPTGRFLDANRIARIAFCAFSLTATSTTFAATGRTPGAFEVSSSGEATYAVPLWTPPGPNGMQPNFALTYNSSAGNGVLGVGWSLSGLSSIERCRRTRGQDASVGGIRLTADDKFCLNGMRLRLTSGTYGAAGSTYQTEKETFAVITAYDTAGTGPSYFIMQGNDALTYEYGRTDDSRVAAGTSSSALRWMLNKVTDRAGNTYVVSYSKANGYAVPTTVSWTPVAQGSSTYRYSAGFAYSTKTEKDSISGFVEQQPIVDNQRLESIEISSSSAVVRKYAFTYDTGAVSQRSRLTQIKECSDAAATNCLAPTVVTYQAGALGVTSTSYPAVSTTVRPGTGPNDFNGDGRDDLLFITGTTWHVAFSTGSGFGAPQNTGIDQSIAARAQRFATNGQDGLLAASGGNWRYYWWNGSAFTSTALSTALPATLHEYTAPDMDGDGLADLVWRANNQIFTRLNATAAGASIPTFSSTSQLAATGNSVGILSFVDAGGYRDIDGDGNDDLMLIRERQPPNTEEPVYYVTPLYSRGALFEAGTELYLGLMNNVLVRLLDFNDDRCADWTTETEIRISRCANTDASTVPMPPGIVSILDWDSDGRDDLLFDNGGYLGVYRSSGSSSPTTALAPAITTSVPYTGAVNFAMDADGDGLQDIFAWDVLAPHALTYYKRPEIVVGDAVITTIPDLATQFADGFGVSFAPRYTTTARSSYTPGQNTEWPLQNISSEVIIHRVTSSDGIGGTYETQYSYVGGRYDVARSEFVGFEQRTKIDGRNNLRVRTTYEQGFPKTGLVKKEELLHANGALISEIANEYSLHAYDPTPLNGRRLPYLFRSTTKQYDLSSAQLLSTTTTTNTVDANSGGTTDSITEVVEAATANGAQPYTYASAIHNTLFSASGCYGRPETTTVTNSNTVPGQSTVVRTMRTLWSPTHCRPTQITIEPGNALWQVTTDLLYDGFGNANHITDTPASGQGQIARITQINWGDTGQLPGVITNAKNQSTTIGWDFSLGVRTSLQLPNGATTTWSPDAFGRIQSETHGDNTRTTFVLTTCAAGNSYCSGPADFRYKLDVRAFDSNDYGTARRTDSFYFDAFDRIRYVDAELLTGTSRTITSYDALGRIASRSVPHAPGGTTGASTYTYDLLGRELLAQRQASVADTTIISSQTTYSGLRSVATDAMGKQQTLVYDALGRIVQSIDALSSRTEYEYDAFGNLLKTIAAAQDPTLRNEIVLTYNVRGFKETSNDPDMGAWDYDYYPFGEMKWQRDAKNQETYFYYDELSRPTTRIEAEGTTSFGYDDPDVNGEGQLTSMSSPGGAYAEAYSYDGIGRLSNHHITIGAESFDYDYTYAANGDLERLTYPTTTGSRLAIEYAYQKGMLTGVSKVGATTYWGSPTLNARGQVISATLGNGVVSQKIIDAITGLPDHIRAGLGGGYGLQNESYLFDYVDNLEQRQNGDPSLTENFIYDDLHRLDYSTLGGTTNLDMTYDALGNITARSDIQNGATWTYHATKRHAVTVAGPNTYSYDANGNAITRNGHEIKWTSDNYPYEINGPGKKLTFDYGPDRQRYRQEYQNGSTTETTLYIGGLLEKVTSGGVTNWRHHIVAGGQTVAIVSRSSAAPEATWYLLNDHLGSVAKILDSSGAAFVSESFAAFGARRDASAWSGPCPCPDLDRIKSVTRQGYTGHDMIGGVSLGLIHMNGRVQDSITGRFLSADPLVQAPFNTQSLNRYSYVFNNPLSGTDPSGFVRWCRKASDSVVDNEEICTDFPDSIPTGPVTPAEPDGGGGPPGRAIQSIGRFLFPNVAALGDRGAPGSTLDFYVGFEKAGLNAMKPFVVVNPLFLPISPFLADFEFEIADQELAGAATFDGLGALAGLRVTRLFGQRTLGLCFAPGTLVHTENGPKPIEAVQVGEKVWSWNDSSGTAELADVVETFVRADQPLVSVTLENAGVLESIRSTPEHPYWTTRGWVPAGELTTGDLVLAKAGEWLPVLGVEGLPEHSIVYNIEVERTHNYFVGEHGALVHNTCQVNLNKIAGDAFRDEIADLLRRAGRQVDIEVYKWTPFGRRFMDIEVRMNGKVLGGIETKVGSSRYTWLQRLKDYYLRHAHNYPVNVVRKP